MQKICSVRSDLEGIHLTRFEQRYKHWWQTMFGKTRHYIVRYEIKAVIGPADLRFELCKPAKPMHTLGGSRDLTMAQGSTIKK